MHSTPENLQVLYEDNHLIIVNKRTGDIVQGDKTGDLPLSDVIKQYLKSKYAKPGNVFCGVVHRLDRPTTGAVIFAKTSKALERLSKMFREGEVHKKYWTLVPKGLMAEEATLINYLKKDEAKNISRSYEKEVPGSKRAVLHYRKLRESDRYMLLEVDLQTGRHHQIRCQFSHIGFTVAGDLKYGSPRSNEDGSICLHARFVSFIHPVSREMIEVEAPLPDFKLWNIFS